MSDRGSWNALFSHPASSVGCEISGWNVGRAKFRMWDIRVECRRRRIPDVRHLSEMLVEQLHPDSLRGYVARSPIRTPSGRSTRHSRSSHPDDSISYPDMLSGSLSHTPYIPDLLMAKDFKASVLHVYELSIALPWIPKNSPQSWIALVIKRLSKHQNLTQFD